MPMANFLTDKCHLSVLNEDVIRQCAPFECGDDDLDDFFLNSAPLFSKELLGKSYCFRLDENPNEIVCAFTVSNDSIRVNILPNNRQKTVRKKYPMKKDYFVTLRC